MSENTNNQNLTPARWTAGTVIGMGLLASVAGNIQSILLEPGPPSVGALLSAVWWPALLFGMIHLALTIPWGGGFWRAGRWIGPGVIGGLAFYVSFFHLAHVLSYYGYDVVSRYAGPLTVDVAMFVATIAWHRVTVAKTLASGHAEVAEVATSAGQEELASAPEVATDDLASDWANLDEELDAELAAMVASAQTAPRPIPEPEPEETPEVAQGPAARANTTTLTRVPELAAKRIRAALDADASNADLAALDAALAAEGIAGSARTARRWRAAVANGTARVS